ncbi:MAG: polysaccharide biosynthesis protein, partial [Prevotella sp.]|nr:polysaccharide biosynthesis protein [Prevotella sp.]
AETIVTSIDRKTRMDTVFSMYRPDYVFHAAAYKHVPMMEDNPSGNSRIVFSSDGLII